MTYKITNQIKHSCKYHVIWCSKYRRKVLTNQIEIKLKELITSFCQEFDIELINIKIEPDHVYLLLNVDPQYGIHKAVKRIKRLTSHELRKEFSELRTKLPTLWTNSYFVTTERNLPIFEIEKFIESQERSQRG